MGIRHLFIDFISIDQKLRGDDLLKQVVAFSTLFKTVPVIAAYDKSGDDFRKTMRRPWILSEARSFRGNPNRIVYVSHCDQGAKRDPSFATTYTGNALLGEFSLFEFGDMLERIWKSSFTQTILSVL
jgi:hypothetical protein